MKEYKMRRGETLDERVPDLRETVEGYFGPVSDTTDLDGHEVYVVGEPTNPVFERIAVGKGTYSGKKDTLIVDFEERPAEEVLAEGLAEHAAEAVAAKNDFLLEITGRDAKSRRKSMKRSVEESETPDGVS
jgi:hypothetical protein